MQLKTFFHTPGREVQHEQALEDGYANWRRESKAVVNSYRSWLRAPRDQRWVAYATYLAALDREEDAASAYRRLVERALAR